MNTPATPQAPGERLGPPAFRLGAGALWAYACMALLFGQRVAGVPFGTALTAVTFAAGFVLIARASRQLGPGPVISRSLMLGIGLASIFLTFACLTLDLMFTVRENLARLSAEASFSAESRASDRNVWHGELYPRSYFPTDRNFQLYKPNVRLTAHTFGERYVSSMLQSPTLVRNVLEPRTLSYAIGPEGLRELEPLSESRIFALGDSFVFGFATGEGRIWPDLLGRSLGEPIYNLGVSSTGPRSQLELLKYLSRQHGESMHVRQLLWMIFEGNDLENAYDEMRPVASTSAVSYVRGTTLEALLAFPTRVRDTSVVRKLLHGQLSFGGGGIQQYGQYQVDGVTLPIPLFHSSKFGDRLFVQDDVEAATRPREYVLTHPNRPLLDQTFREMRDLSKQSSFEVVVVIAPSDARLYGEAFDGFPKLSSEPHFINYVARLSEEMGFRVINLLDLLKPFAERELLFYRDDHHWNERGNEVVAQLLHGALARHGE